MSSEKSLKSQNGVSLWVLFLFNIVLLIFLLFANSFNGAELSLKLFLSLRSAGLIVAYIIVFVVNGQVSASAKAKLVFLRFKDPLPGCRAFSRHGKNDHRVNMDALTRLHGSLPNLPREQNQLWYKIYKSHASDVTVIKSHRDFLLARDMTSMSVLFLVFAGIPAIFLSNWPWNFSYFALLLLIYLVMSNLARNHGCRFVTNVLALESVK
jgi:hypothetical protein